MKHLLITLTAITLTPALAHAGHGAKGHESAHAAPHAINTEIEADIDVTVNGLVCDFCAQALEKTFGKRAEVNDIDVDLGNHRVAIDLKDGADINDETVTKLITNSGYDVVKINRAQATK